ncbi:MAG: hypothetical protein QF902_04145, partial [Rhodospirillales bacterium]|nr:hypothetical protein [Rhodospirillales bacterium]
PADTDAASLLNLLEKVRRIRAIRRSGDAGTAKAIAATAATAVERMVILCPLLVQSTSDRPDSHRTIGWTCRANFVCRFGSTPD